MRAAIVALAMNVKSHGQVFWVTRQGAYGFGRRDSIRCAVDYSGRRFLRGWLLESRGIDLLRRRSQRGYGSARSAWTQLANELPRSRSQR